MLTKVALDANLSHRPASPFQRFSLVHSGGLSMIFRGGQGVCLDQWRGGWEHHVWHSISSLGEQWERNFWLGFGRRVYGVEVDLRG